MVPQQYYKSINVSINGVVKNVLIPLLPGDGSNELFDTVVHPVQETEQVQVTSQVQVTQQVQETRQVQVTQQVQATRQFQACYSLPVVSNVSSQQRSTNLSAEVEAGHFRSTVAARWPVGAISGPVGAASGLLGATNGRVGAVYGHAPLPPNLEQLSVSRFPPGWVRTHGAPSEHTNVSIVRFPPASVLMLQQALASSAGVYRQAFDQLRVASLPNYCVSSEQLGSTSLPASMLASHGGSSPMPGAHLYRNFSPDMNIQNQPDVRLAQSSPRQVTNAAASPRTISLSHSVQGRIRKDLLVSIAEPPVPYTVASGTRIIRILSSNRKQVGSNSQTLTRQQVSRASNQTIVNLPNANQTKVADSGLEGRPPLYSAAHTPTQVVQHATSELSAVDLCDAENVQYQNASRNYSTLASQNVIEIFPDEDEQSNEMENNAVDIVSDSITKSRELLDTLLAKKLSDRKLERVFKAKRTGGRPKSTLDRPLLTPPRKARRGRPPKRSKNALPNAKSQVKNCIVSVERLSLSKIPVACRKTNSAVCNGDRTVLVDISQNGITQPSAPSRSSTESACSDGYLEPGDNFLCAADKLRKRTVGDDDEDCVVVQDGAVVTDDTSSVAVKKSKFSIIDIRSAREVFKSAANTWKSRVEWNSLGRPELKSPNSTSKESSKSSNHDNASTVTETEAMLRPPAIGLRAAAVNTWNQRLAVISDKASKNMSGNEKVTTCQVKSATGAKALSDSRSISQENSPAISTPLGSVANSSGFQKQSTGMKRRFLYVTTKGGTFLVPLNKYCGSNSAVVSSSSASMSDVSLTASSARGVSTPLSLNSTVAMRHSPVRSVAMATGSPIATHSISSCSSPASSVAVREDLPSLTSLSASTARSKKSLPTAATAVSSAACVKQEPVMDSDSSSTNDADSVDESQLGPIRPSHKERISRLKAMMLEQEKQLEAVRRHRTVKK